MGESDAMMLALSVEPMGGGDWRWCWYDHDSGAAFADGVEGAEVAAWSAALTHYVERSDECVRALVECTHAAEAALAAAQAERAEAVAAARAEGEAAGYQQAVSDACVAVLALHADEVLCAHGGEAALLAAESAVGALAVQRGQR